MHTIAPLINDLAVMLGVASVVTLLFQRIRQPVVLGYLVAGMIIGPYTPPHAFVYDISNIRILSELGVIFLMFSLGLEFSFKKLTRVGFSATVTGMLEIILMILVGYGVGMLLGWSHYDCLFLGAALSISSTTIIIKAIDELGLKSKHFAELIFGVLIVEDLVAILLLVALSTTVATNNIFSADMLSASYRLLLVVGGWFLVGYFLVPPIFRKVASYISQETLTILSVALCLSLVCAAASFQYSSALGAFIMGSILAETVMVQRIERLIQPIRDIFAAVFFISVGMLIDPRVIFNHWFVVILLSLVTIIGKLLTTSLAAFSTGQNINTSLRTGFGMAQVGEFSFIIAALGVSLQVTSDTLYPLIVAVSGVTTFTTPYLMRFSGYFSKRVENSMPHKMKWFLDSYSARMLRAQFGMSPVWRKIVLRVLINGIIIAIIFTVVDSWVFSSMPWLNEESLIANAIRLLAALIFASPFIWGVLFAFKGVRRSEVIEKQFNSTEFIIWLLILTEIAVLSIMYFRSWLTLILCAGAGLIFFVFLYKHLEASYHWFEQQLVDNINMDEVDKPSNVVLVPVIFINLHLKEEHVCVGKTIREVQMDLMVTIVGFERNNVRILNPDIETVLCVNDTLLIVGDEEHVQKIIV